MLVKGDRLYKCLLSWSKGCQRGVLVILINKLIKVLQRALRGELVNKIIAS